MDALYFSHIKALRSMFSYPFNNLILCIKNISSLALNIFPLMISFLKAGVFDKFIAI